MIEYDDDGQPIEKGYKFRSESERAAYWLRVNHAPQRAHLADLSCNGRHA